MRQWWQNAKERVGAWWTQPALRRLWARLRQWRDHREPGRGWLDHAVLFMVLLAVPPAIYLLIYLPGWYVDGLKEFVLKTSGAPYELKRFELENELRKTMSQIVLGVFGRALGQGEFQKRRS
jgi:hypothetical protein